MQQQDNLLIKAKRLFWNPLDPYLFYAMLAVYLMSMFLLYSADGQDIGRLENKTLHTFIGVGLLLVFSRIRPQILSQFALPIYVLGVLLLLGVHFFGGCTFCGKSGLAVLRIPFTSSDTCPVFRRRR